MRPPRLLMMEVRQSPEELAEITVELLRRDGLREDVYVRPIIYKSSETIGVRLHNLDADITIFGVPFGQYIDTEGGIRAQVSTWRRTDDNAIPARGKITGAYVNGALAKSEAQLNGFDEAIVLTADGHVSEGSAENLFIVKDGVLITPPVTDNILEGITRGRLIEIARDDLGSRSNALASTGPSCTRPTRCSCAAPAPRSARSSRSTVGRSAGGRPGPITPRAVARPTSTPYAAGCLPTATGSPPSTRRRRGGSASAPPAARPAGDIDDHLGLPRSLPLARPAARDGARHDLVGHPDPADLAELQLSRLVAYFVLASTSTGCAARCGSAAR